MNIEHFNDFLAAALAQPLPQRLLFVFAGVELPDEATAEQRAAFEAGQGGALVPLMCVDKSPEELQSFEGLAGEAGQFGKRWALVFSAALSGTRQQPPTTNDTDKPLQHMVESIQRGEIAAYLAFDRDGVPVQLD
jgi:hypothetical protein